MTWVPWVLGALIWALVIAAAHTAGRPRRTPVPPPPELPDASPVVWSDAQLDRLLDELRRHPRGGR